VQKTGVEALLTEPIGERDAGPDPGTSGRAEFKRDGERSALAKFTEEIIEALKLVAVFRCEADAGSMPSCQRP